MHARTLFAVLLLSLAPAAALAESPPTKDPAPAGDEKGATVAKLVERLPKCATIAGCPAIRELLRRGDAVWPELKAGLEHKAEMVRFWTLGVLSERPIPASRDAVGALLGDKEIRVRAAAAYALGAHKDPAVTPYLLKAIKDEDLNVRFAAAVAMGRVKDPATIPALTAACRDKDEDVRAYAALALGDIGDKKVTPTLIERLEQDLHAKVRGFAAMALSKLNDPRAFAALAGRAKEEEDPKALAATIFALGELGDARAIGVLEATAARVKASRDKALRESREVAEYLAEALQKLRKAGDEAAKPSK